MASFQVHNDQENRATNFLFANKENVQQKRTVLGTIDNKPERMLKTKQPLGVRNKNVVNDENAVCKPFANKQAPVIPVAQFQAFKVYEEADDKKPVRYENQRKEVEQYESLRIKEVFQNFYKGTAGEKLVTKKEALEQSGIFDLPKPQVIEVPVPMSIEKSANKSETEGAQVNVSRNKDLFFELDEYREDIYEYLREKELRHRAKPNYMRKQPDITHNMRTILVDWLVEVSEEYKLQTETLYLAINYIDRFLSYMSVVRAKLQLVGTAAMFIAAKYEEIYPPDVSEFVYITDDTYSKRQVIRMEVLILKVLDFDLSVPTPYTFITALSIANRLSEKSTFLAQFLSELALLEAEPTLEILPSVMAAGAIAVARNAIGESAWTPELTANTGYTLAELRPAVEHLTELHRKAATLPQQAIQEKYKQGKYLHVSQIAPADKIIAFD